MTTLNDTIIDIADCHSTLYYFDETAPQTPLPLGDKDGYGELYASVASSRTYESLSGAPGRLLNKITPAFRNNKYWRRRLRTGTFDGYPWLAWKNIIPLECTPKVRVEMAPAPGAAFKVSPVPRIVLYPFGWSSWLSLRVTGDHEISQLADLVSRLFQEKPLNIFDDKGTLAASGSIRDLFDFLAEGVRADAFGGDQTFDTESEELIQVITVLSKWGGSLPKDHLEKFPMLGRMVKPEGTAPTDPLSDHIFQPDIADSARYLVMRGDSRFIWIEQLLNPVDRNYKHLRCYHNNNFLSLMHARHLFNFLTTANDSGNSNSGLLELKKNALAFLRNPGYKNASLRKFTEAAEVKKILEPPKDQPVQ